MRDVFHEQLDAVFVDLSTICGQVQTAVTLATTALLEADSDVAEQVISGDVEIDRARLAVEEKCFELLSLQQPVAGDLRVVVAALRMVTELERMGDLSVHVAKIARMRVPERAVPAEIQPTHLPGKPIPLPRQPGDHRPSEALPDVQVRQEGDQSIQEYRQSGRLYMVVVTPKHGVPQTYMVDAQGRLRDQAGQPPVRPVMYKVMEWGKSPAPQDDRSDSSDAGAGR